MFFLQDIDVNFQNVENEVLYEVERYHLYMQSKNLIFGIYFCTILNKTTVKNKIITFSTHS